MADGDDDAAAPVKPIEPECLAVPESRASVKPKREAVVADSAREPTKSDSCRDKSPSGTGAIPRVRSPATRDTTSSSHGRSAGSARLKVATQEARISLMRDLLNDLTRETSAALSREEIDEAKQSALDVWQMFASVHDTLIEHLSDDTLVQEYAEADQNSKAFSLRMAICQRVGKLRATLNTALSTTGSAQSGSSDTTGLRHPLPEISLPKFTGEYSQWVPFRDMFTSLVRENSQITDVEKMHYLLTAVTGEASKLISSLHISGDSLTTAWNTLLERYNKRALVSSHLDTLLSTETVSPRSAKDLHSLLHSLKAAYNALETLGAPVRQWDWVIVHVVSRRLDSHLRKAWELKAGRSDEPPSLSDLRVFLISRARALKNVEATRSQARATGKDSSSETYASRVHAVSSGPSHAGPSTSGSSSVTTGYACSYCKGAHYIVACPSFRQLTSEARRDEVMHQHLCFNCLGKHSVAACQGTTRCKECDRKHHTMIHTGWSKFGDQSSSGPTPRTNASSSAGTASSSATPRPSGSTQ